MIRNLEIYEFINMLDAFLEDESKNVFDIGEAVGCNLLRYIANESVRYHEFKNILFIMGSPDSAYASDKPNMVYWKWLFNEMIVDNIHNDFDPLVNPTFKYKRNEYKEILVPSTIKPYSLIIINQAQLIPRKYMDMILHEYSMQVIRIYDVFDICGEDVDVPLRCLDTFEKLPMTIAYARSLFGIETRSINRRATNKFVSGINIKHRSIGKIDDNQYVTSDPTILQECINKQIGIPFRKNHKVYIDDRMFNIVEDRQYEHVHSLGKGTLLHILQGNEDNIIKYNIHHSKTVFEGYLSYDPNPYLSPSNTLRVRPANILPMNYILNEHYFKQIVYVTTKETPLISIREQYTLLKQSQNLIIAKTK